MLTCTKAGHTLQLTNIIRVAEIPTRLGSRWNYSRELVCVFHDFVVLLIFIKRAAGHRDAGGKQRGMIQREYYYYF
jgi:hypothetical protein